MNFSYTLSIIIPTLNSQATISACLESIVIQSWQDYEVIIMDGQSDDETVELVASYVSKYSKIKLFSKKDSGIYDAMNKGINISKGKYLFFLGSDDELYSTNTLKEVFSHLQLADFTYGNVCIKNTNVIYSGESSLEKLLYNQVSICHQAIFYSRRTFELLGNYDLNYFIHADYEFNVRCFENDLIIKNHIPNIIAYYNENGISNTQANSDHFHDDLTLKYINKKSGLFALFNDYKQIKRELEQLKESRFFIIKNQISNTLRWFKKAIHMDPLR